MAKSRKREKSPSNGHGHDEVLPFPCDAFPPSVCRFVKSAAASLPCPPDFIGMVVLVLLGAAIGLRRQLEIKKNWKERPSIYGAIVASPGEKKSPGMNLAMQPFRIRQKELFADYEIELESFEQELAEWNKEKEGPMPTKPIRKQLFTTDITVESLVMLLGDNEKGIVLACDELTSWVHSLNQYKGGKGSDRQHFLSFWSGASVVVNRKTDDDPLVVDSPFLSVIGCLQPDVLGDLVDNSGREDGYVDRILFSFPDPVELKWTEKCVSDHDMQAYENVFRHLWQTGRRGS